MNSVKREQATSQNILKLWPALSPLTWTFPTTPTLTMAPFVSCQKAFLWSRVSQNCVSCSTLSTLLKRAACTWVVSSLKNHLCKSLSFLLSMMTLNSQGSSTSVQGCWKWSVFASWKYVLKLQTSVTSQRITWQCVCWRWDIWQMLSWILTTVTWPMIQLKTSLRQWRNAVKRQKKLQLTWERIRNWSWNCTSRSRKIYKEAELQSGLTIRMRGMRVHWKSLWDDLIELKSWNLDTWLSSAFK